MHFIDNTTLAHYNPLGGGLVHVQHMLQFFLDHFLNELIYLLLEIMRSPFPH
jgi:hypothetical protein